MDYELLFLKSLLLTILIEIPVMFIYFRLFDKLSELKIYRVLITGFIASFATLPYLWFILPNYIDQKMMYIIIGESFAIIVETFIIEAILRTKFLKSFLCSLSCNAISFLLGLIIKW